MQNVMSDILEVTESQVDVLIATHEHWDHVRVGLRSGGGPVRGN